MWGAVGALLIEFVTVLFLEISAAIANQVMSLRTE